MQAIGVAGGRDKCSLVMVKGVVAAIDYSSELDFKVKAKLLDFKVKVMHVYS